MSEYTPTQIFGRLVSQTAQKQFKASLKTEEGKKAAQRVTMAFVGAMTSSKSPNAYRNVSDNSVANCVATSIATGLYPGGPSPTVYLVPMAGALNWWITHRGLTILAARAGFGVMAVPVGVEDHLKVAYGEAYEHEADPQSWPDGLGDILGVIVVVRRLSDGAVIARPWVPRALILKRKAIAKSSGIWNKWPIEMAQKTAIKWANARGVIPMDSPEIQAALESDRDFIDADESAETSAPRTVTNVADALELEPQEAPDDHQLPDHGNIPETIDAPEREKVEAKKPAPKPRSRRKNMDLPS